MAVPKARPLLVLASVALAFLRHCAPCVGLDEIRLKGGRKLDGVDSGLYERQHAQNQDRFGYELIEKGQDRVHHA